LDHLIWNENGRSFHICLLCTTIVYHIRHTVKNLLCVRKKLLYDVTGSMWE
jgi:hypothetical protein